MDTPVVNMYFVAIVLPQDLNEKVLRHKMLMQEKYNCQVALKSPAHITIAPPFWMNAAKENDLVQAVDTLSRGFLAFPVTTNNFSVPDKCLFQFDRWQNGSGFFVSRF